jgi:hypothetical protein
MEQEPDKHVICRVFNVATGDWLHMRQGPGANYPKVKLRSGGGEVSMPSTAANITVYVADWEKNDNDVWFPVYWHGYRGYLNQKFLTPVH